MTRRTATLHLWRLRAKGYDCWLRQFSPDRSGWGVALGIDTLKTVAACELTERVEPEAWTDLLQAIQEGR